MLEALQLMPGKQQPQNLHHDHQMISHACFSFP
jgi:hypothetical protein